METRQALPEGTCPKWPVKSCKNCHHAYIYSCKGDGLECDNALVCMNWEPEGNAITGQPPICLDEQQGVCSCACLECKQNPANK